MRLHHHLPWTNFRQSGLNYHLSYVALRSNCVAIQKNLITRELKLDVLMCIGEIFLHCGNSCLKHIQKVMDLLLISCEGVLAISDLNYAEILQESIIETLMCIMHGV